MHPPAPFHARSPTNKNNRILSFGVPKQLPCRAAIPPPIAASFSLQTVSPQGCDNKFPWNSRVFGSIDGTVTEITVYLDWAPNVGPPLPRALPSGELESQTQSELKHENLHCFDGRKKCNSWECLSGVRKRRSFLRQAG
jgi:hypothetical protein